MNDTQDLIQVRVQDEYRSNVSLQSDVVSEFIHTVKTTLISTMHKFYSTIDFLKVEIEEKKLLIRTLLLPEANDGTCVDANLLDSTNQWLIETTQGNNITHNSSIKIQNTSIIINSSHIPKGAYLMTQKNMSIKMRLGNQTI